ncbi:MAG: DUF3783 domain-containing protein [Calditerrivibrio sp.]|nr:DUF3783 domain-containing protein [Calditerrivibrio sp.]
MDIKKCIFLGGFSEDEIDLLSKNVVYDIKEIFEEDMGTVLSSLSESSKKGSKMSRRFILFDGLTKDEIGDFIQTYKGLNLKRPIMAMITEHSIRWTLGYLFEHLLEEEAKLLSRL